MRLVVLFTQRRGSHCRLVDPVLKLISSFGKALAFVHRAKGKGVYKMVVINLLLIDLRDVSCCGHVTGTIADTRKVVPPALMPLYPRTWGQTTNT